MLKKEVKPNVARILYLGRKIRENELDIEAFRDTGLFMTEEMYMKMYAKESDVVRGDTDWVCRYAGGYAIQAHGDIAEPTSLKWRYISTFGTPTEDGTSKLDIQVSGTIEEVEEYLYERA